MKICYVGDNNEGALKRCQAFIKVNPQYEHFYALIGPHKQKHHTIPYDITHIDETEFRYSDYDLVLNMNDKTFFILAEQIEPRIPNFTDKKTLSEFAKQFGFNVPKDENFQDCDLVFVKPTLSSGGYSEEKFCYRKIDFGAVKAFASNDKYLIQQYIPSDLTLQFGVVSNGKEAHIYDIILLEFKTDLVGKTMVVYGESDYNKFSSLYPEQCKRVLEFIKVSGYDRVKGIFTLQFLDPGNGWYLHDFNTRTGPFTVELELNNFINTRIYKMLPFIAGKKTFNDVNQNIENYRHYTEDNGRILSDVRIFPSSNRLHVVSNKRSGMIRNDYQVFIERI
jgi:hypothetical protein